MSKKAWRDFAVDSVIAVAFILSALGGIVLYLAPGGYQGGRNPYYGREVLFLGHDAWNGLHLDQLRVAGRCAGAPCAALEVDRVHG